MNDSVIRPKIAVAAANCKNEDWVTLLSGSQRKQLATWGEFDTAS